MKKMKNEKKGKKKEKKREESCVIILRIPRLTSGRWIPRLSMVFYGIANDTSRRRTYFLVNVLHSLEGGFQTYHKS